MTKKSSHSIGKDFDFYISVISVVILAVTIALVVIAIFDKNSHGEASIGSFDVIDFNNGWTLDTDNQQLDISLPYQLNIVRGQMGTVTNTLPENLTDNMSLMLRASMEDVYVYVDGELRSEYSSDGIDNLSYYLPSAYIVTELNSADSGKDIRIDIRFKATGVINEITIGHGNNVWYPIIVNSIPVNLAAIIVLILGIILSATLVFLNKTLVRSNAARYLGFLMLDIALWVLSESSIRQFIFRHASLSGIFAYLSVELTGVFACMYFDAVQHQTYHRIYRVVEGIMLAQLLLNIGLFMTNIKEFYQTLMFSHVWLGVGILVALTLIIKDLISKEIRKYRITAIGIVCFLVSSVAEIIGFYQTRIQGFGTFACIGLVFLMTFTIVQALVDEAEMAIERERKQFRVLSNAIETVASSIDAKDEYTGGHSERVGEYAEKLARRVAVDYGFSEEDILRIKYIGLVHDIGKIGVADTVLNKAGRLTDEEFSLMKKHTEIGYEIMGATGESMEGLLDGIKYHHERFDGKGYPEGLSYTDIPLIARILSLADSYDAMTSNRVYRKRLSDEEVRNELLRCSGSQFDPALTDAFVKLIDDGELVISTENGMATDQDGNVLISAKLENRLHSDLLLNKANITNPSHVRMMCYVIKLMEKKQRKITVVFCGPDLSKLTDDSSVDEAWKSINTVSKEFLSGQDMVIRYSNEFNAMAIFDRTDAEINGFYDRLKEGCPDCIVFNIND